MPKEVVPVWFVSYYFDGVILATTIFSHASLIHSSEFYLSHSI